MNDSERITLDEFLPHPAEKVWQALTTADGLAGWLMPNDFTTARVGHRFHLDDDDWGTTECEILELDEPKLMRLAWRNPPLDTVVTWQLVPEGNGVRILVTHDGFDPSDPIQRAALDAMTGGWGHLVDEELRAHLDRTTTM